MTDPSKTIEDSFRDWEVNAFGYGYGTGDEHVLTALKSFMGVVGKGAQAPHSYDYARLERACGPQVTWLIINRFCRLGLIDYGTSPRYGFLSDEGIKLKQFIDTHTVDEMYDICADYDENAVICYPDVCNCGPNGYDPSRVCQNPFWNARQGRK